MHIPPHIYVFMYVCMCVFHFGPLGLSLVIRAQGQGVSRTLPSRFGFWRTRDKSWPPAVNRPLTGIRTQL